MITDELFPNKDIRMEEESKLLDYVTYTRSVEKLFVFLVDNKAY